MDHCAASDELSEKLEVGSLPRAGVPGYRTAGPSSAQLELGSADGQADLRLLSLHLTKLGVRSRSGGMMRIDQLPHQIVEHRIDSLAGPQLALMSSCIAYLLASGIDT